MNMPRPPYPFPDKWDTVNRIQIAANEKYWQVVIAERNVPNDLMDEIFELNEEWVNHFSNTIQRIRNKKRKVYDPELIANSDSLLSFPTNNANNEPIMITQPLKPKSNRQLKKNARIRPRKPIAGDVIV